MTNTEIQADITSAALTKLGAGDTVSASDQAVADAALVRQVDRMNAQGEIWFTSDSLQEDVRALLIPVVAFAVADAFPVAEDRIRRIAGEAAAARRDLIAMNRKKSGGPVRFEDF